MLGLSLAFQAQCGHAAMVVTGVDLSLAFETPILALAHPRDEQSRERK